LSVVVLSQLKFSCCYLQVNCAAFFNKLHMSPMVQNGLRHRNTC